MSDKQTKRPAHEVIVEMIAEAIKDLSGVDPEAAGEIGLHVAKIATLGEVMRRMVIPRDRKGEIAVGLDRAYRVPLVASVAEQVCYHIDNLLSMLERDDQ